MNTIFLNEHEDKFLSIMLSAPAKEIEKLIPETIADCSKMLKISPNEYDYSIHYPMILGITRRKWAEAMITEVMKG